MNNISNSNQSIPIKTFLDMKIRTETFVKNKGRNPLTVRIDNLNYITFQKFEDMLKRATKFKALNGRWPYSVSINPPIQVFNSDKSPLLTQISKAVGGKFNTFSEFYALVRKNEDYAFYIGDKNKQQDAIDRLLRNVGLNCVDFSQIGVAVLLELKKVANKQYEFNYVRTYCTQEKVGHVLLEVKGEELGSKFVYADLAAAASNGSQYALGKAWCQSYEPKIRNQDYLKLDDGR